jgi:hypothetical protein
MRTTLKPVPLVLALTATLVVGSGIVLRDVGAQAPTPSVWLWKDLKGNCPATCDRNLYECPCRTENQT